jgi:hypothetical protein
MRRWFAAIILRFSGLHEIMLRFAPAGIKVVLRQAQHDKEMTKE